jgi:DNA-binding MltR family transcriptional regulator
MVQSASRQLLDRLPSEQEMAEAVSALKRSSDTTVVLMSAAYIDHALELLLRSAFSRLSKSDDAFLFDSARNAVLGSLSSKIRIAYAMGLLITDVYHDLLLMNNVRNLFAHSLHRKISFKTPAVIDDCDKLQYVAMRQRIWEKPKTLSPRQRFIQTFENAYAAMRSISDSKEQMRTAMAATLARYDESAASSAAPTPSTPSPRKHPPRSHRSHSPTKE